MLIQIVINIPSPFASIVGVGDSSKLLELCLEFRVGSPFIDSVDKELAALFSVGSHDSQMVVRWARLSLSLKQYHHKPASANPEQKCIYISI